MNAPLHEAADFLARFVPEQGWTLNTEDGDAPFLQSATEHTEIYCSEAPGIGRRTRHRFVVVTISDCTGCGPEDAPPAVDEVFASCDARAVAARAASEEFPYYLRSKARKVEAGEE